MGKKSRWLHSEVKVYSCDSHYSWATRIVGAEHHEVATAEWVLDFVGGVHGICLFYWDCIRSVGDRLIGQCPSRVKPMKTEYQFLVLIVSEIG